MSIGKKRTGIIAFIAVLLMAALAFGLSAPKLTASADTALRWESTTQTGKIDDRIAFGYGDGNIGDLSVFGSQLLEDETMGINRGQMEFVLGGAWGNRYSFQYPMDLRDFHIQVDLENQPVATRVLLIFSHTKGGYMGLGDGKKGDGMAIAIYRGYSDDNGENTDWGFIVTNADHNVALKTATPDFGKPLDFDAGSTGISLKQTETVFDISFKQETEDGAFKLVIANGETDMQRGEWSIPYDEFSSVFFDVSNVYLCLGAMGSSACIRVNELTEPKLTAYEAVAQPMLEDIADYVSKANAAGTDATKIKEAVTAYAKVDTSVLRSNDVNAVEKSLEEANAALRTGKASLSAEDLQEVTEADIVNYEATIAKATDNASLAVADALRDEVLHDAELLGTNVSAVASKVTAAEDKMKAKLLSVIGGYVTEFETAANNINSSATLVELQNVRNDMYEYYSHDLVSDADEIAGYSARIAAANAKISALGSLSGWTADEGARIYTADGKTAEFGALNGLNENLTDHTGSTVVRNEKVDVTDWSTTLQLRRHGLAVDREMDWVAIGVMKNANNFFINNDLNDDEGIENMHSNLGFFMYFTIMPNDKLRVTVFILKNSSNALYDGYRGDMIIDYVEGSDLKVKVYAEDKDRTTYANIFINDQKYTGTNVQASELRGVFGDSYEGNFMIAHARSYYDVTMKDFNGKDLAGADAPVSGGDGSGNNNNQGNNQGGESGGSEESGSGCGSTAASGAAGVAAVLLASAAVIAASKRSRKQSRGENR